jgi:hypothetical protein
LIMDQHYIVNKSNPYTVKSHYNKSESLPLAPTPSSLDNLNRTKEEDLSNKKDNLRGYGFR